MPPIGWRLSSRFRAFSADSQRHCAREAMYGGGFDDGAGGQFGGDAQFGGGGQFGGGQARF